MKLFEYPADKTLNRLPKDGTVNYYGILLNAEKADFYRRRLLANIAWQHDEAIIYGKRVVTKRQVAW
jgi:hypothetical protein